MEYDILAWYRRSRIENVLENRLAKYNLKLSLPKITYTSKGVSTDREIELKHGELKKSITVWRDFYPDDYSASILFQLEGNAEATIFSYKDNLKYSDNASCYLYNITHKALFNSLKRQKDLAFCVSETRARHKITGYFVEGDINRFTEMLVDYWVRTFYKSKVFRL